MSVLTDPIGFRADLGELVDRSGLSRRAVADRAHINPGYLTSILKGDRHPSAQVVRMLDEALDAGGQLTRYTGDTDLDDELYRHAADATSISRDRLGALAATLKATRDEDDVLGSAQVIDFAQVRLERLETMVLSSRGPLRPDLVGVAGQWAQFVGWLLISTGQYGPAQAVLRTALEWVTEAGDPDLAATVVSYQAHRSWLTAQPHETLGLTMSALADPRVHPAQRAYDLFQAARAHAVCGDLVAVDRLLGEAGEVVASISMFQGPMPPWHYYRDQWQWDAERGLALRYAARHDPHRAGPAIEALSAGIGGVPAVMHDADWYAEYLAHYAAALTDGGRLDEASPILARAGRIAAAAKSRRVTTMVNHARVRLLSAA